MILRKQEDKACRSSRFEERTAPAEEWSLFHWANAVPGPLITERVNALVWTVYPNLIWQQRHGCEELQARYRRLQNMRLSVTLERYILEIKRLVQQARRSPLIVTMTACRCHVAFATVKSRASMQFVGVTITQSNCGT